MSTTCAAMINHEWERVYYKTLYSQAVRMLSVYMTYGGTNVSIEIF
jgi:hypothetical protein